MNIENALRRLVPDPKFYGRLFSRDDYDNKIVWIDARQKPTWEEIVTADSLNEADEAMRIASETQIKNNERSARSYTKLLVLSGMSPADVSAWVDTNINSFSDAKDAIKTLAIAVSVLARRI